MHRLLRLRVQRTHLNLSGYTAPASFFASNRRFPENVNEFYHRVFIGDGCRRLMMLEVNGKVEENERVLVNGFGYWCLSIINPKRSSKAFETSSSSSSSLNNPRVFVFMNLPLKRNPT